VLQVPCTVARMPRRLAVRTQAAASGGVGQVRHSTCSWLFSQCTYIALSCKHCVHSRQRTSTSSAKCQSKGLLQAVPPTLRARQLAGAEVRLCLGRCS
jgi:hypothetical protein